MRAYARTNVGLAECLKLAAKTDSYMLLAANMQQRPETGLELCENVTQQNVSMIWRNFILRAR